MTRADRMRRQKAARERAAAALASAALRARMRAIAGDWRARLAEMGQQPVQGGSDVAKPLGGDAGEVDGVLRGGVVERAVSVDGLSENTQHAFQFVGFFPQVHGVTVVVSLRERILGWLDRHVPGLGQLGEDDENAKADRVADAILDALLGKGALTVAIGSVVMLAVVAVVAQVLR